MKSLLIFVFSLILFQQSFAQALTKSELIGTWKVVQILRYEGPTIVDPPEYDTAKLTLFKK